MILAQNTIAFFGGLAPTQLVVQALQPQCREKLGKIPQTEIVSVCGPVGTPNLDSGIWWENVKCIRGYRANPRFITMASGYFQKNQQSRADVSMSKEKEG